MNKKHLATAVLAIIMGSAGTAYAADVVTIDFDGAAVTNGDVEVKSLDWTVGNVLSVQAVPEPADLTGTSTSGTAGTLGYTTTATFQFDTQVYYQAVLGTYVNPIGTAIQPTGMNTTFEWTVTAGVNETATVDVNTILTDFGGDAALGGGDDVYTISTEATFTLSGTQTDNFYRIYYDDTLGDLSGGYNLEGTGFTDGDLILDGTVSSLIGDFSAQELLTFVDLNNNGQFDAATESGTITTTYALLDSSGTDDWSTATLEYLSIDGTGATDFDVNVTTADGAFFKDDITQLTQDLFFNTSNIVPYDEQDPSKRFTQGDGTVLTNCTDFFIGDCTGSTIVNGLDGPSILLQSDGNNSFALTAVPEPSLVALLGMSSLSMFGLLGLRGRRQRG